LWIDQSLKIQNMSLKLITLAAFAATAQAACTAAETTAMTDCTKKIMDDMIKTPWTKDNYCAKSQSLYACYPACYCDDAAYKETLDLAIKTSADAAKAMGGGDCTIKCGAGSALAPGMALTLALMVAARLYE
jgi:hypothetical protein